jgi:hypothetical protein
MFACPKCELESDGAAECARCGIVFARWRARDAAPVLAAEAAQAAAPTDELVAEFVSEVPGDSAPDAGDDAVQIDRAGWLSYGGGLLAAFLAMQFPLVQAALSGMTVLVHEMGHAAFGWLYGYPSIPAFDFSYGGGVTLQHERSLLVLGAVFAAGSYGVYALRAHALLRNALAALLALHALVALTPAHEVAIIAMGHGGELGFATLALHRALSGRGCKLEAERPLYGLVGWFLVLSGGQFAWRLRTSAFHREVYEEAKGGGHWMDFSRLAEEHLHTSLEAVATVFLLCCLVPPVLALAVQRLRRE